MGKFWWVGVATFAFIVECSSFCVPALRSRWPVGPPRLLEASGFSDKSTARATTYWMAKKYQTLLSSSEVEELPKANNGSSSDEEDGALSDHPAPFTPKILRWTESRRIFITIVMMNATKSWFMHVVTIVIPISMSTVKIVLVLTCMAVKGGHGCQLPNGRATDTLSKICRANIIFRKTYQDAPSHDLLARSCTPSTRKGGGDAAFNLVVNAGFISSVVVFAIVTIFTIDTEISRGWTAGEVILRIPVDNWLAYTSMLRDNPVLVKACTSGIVYTLGDWTAQTFEGTALESIKRDRVARSAVAGLLLHGPLSHVWYDLCERMFDFIGLNDFWWVAAPKVVVDQILWGPFWNAVYIWFVGTLKGDSFETIREAVVTTALPLVIAGIRLWPLAHLVTYGVIPIENRLLWVDFVEIIWVTILSRQAAEQARANDEPDGESAASGEVSEEAGTQAEMETAIKRETAL